MIENHLAYFYGTVAEDKPVKYNTLNMKNLDTATKPKTSNLNMKYDYFERYQNFMQHEQQSFWPLRWH